METNEIRSYKTNIYLEEYLKLIDLEKVEKTEKAIGSIYYSFLKNPIRCQHKNREGYKIWEYKNNNLVEYEIGMLVTYVEFVLKEQIKNLKYVEQLNLFKDGEENNG